MRRYLNCGCGEKYCVADEWINIDFNSSNKEILSVNLLGRLPFNDKSIDVIYNSCMLEHFTKEQGEKFIDECFRVLKPRGILRVVVPDLEDICKEYLKILNECRNSNESKRKYDYIIIELIDQMTRNHAGGEMQKYWDADDKDEEYILYRTGYPASEEKNMSEFHKLVSKLDWYMHLIIEKMLGKTQLYKQYKAGKFAFSGELHKWMYDSYSLQCVLEDKGFGNIKVRKYNDSDIPEWEQYRLEVTIEGREYKPHCLYMEAIKK